ncbi:Nramp family divalent metal transporter [Methanogenium organophilum]|uniref:Nramp family divalent metal transporter n=1 Tax=Methanogenium organophilum TaxID=2199 RepID=A0A9X9T9W7_METOG|nr:Nramp family divalent metal transporter [Methanogenium organophilum]WAI02502.1 Nramp family divalent metal transporter [Methanogenium organophilum]
MLSGLRRRIPAGIAETLFFIGPGLILAIEASGESGITELLAAGLEYGFSLFWVIGAALIFKFAFTNGIARYTVATGTSIFDGLRTIPGPKNWEVTFISIIYFFEMVGFGGVALFAGSMLAEVVPAAVPAAYAFALLIFTLLVLWKDSYERLEHVVILLSVVMFAGLAVIIFALPFPLAQIAQGCVPSVPDGALIETMALLGVVGSGLNILLYSVWLHEKVGDRHGEKYFSSHMKSVNIDLVLAFLLVGVVALIFMTLGFWGFVAEHLTGASAAAVTESLHASLDKVPGGLHTILFVAVVILAGALISGMDGRARAVSSVVSRVSPTRFEERTLYRMVLLIFAGIITLGILSGETTSLIRTVAAVSSVMFGLLGFMLIYLDRRLPAYARGSPLWLLTVGCGSVLFLAIALMTEQSLVTFGLPLMERVAVVVILLYAFTKTGLFERLVTGRGTLEDRGWMILTFGVLSLYGIYRGILYNGVIVDFADLGPMVAGILGGPVVGGCVGLIAAAFRLTEGGIGAIGSAVSAVFSGIIAAYAARMFRNHLTYWRLILLAIGIEFLHVFVLIPLFSGGWDSLAMWHIIRETYLPMAAANALGLVLFLSILRERGYEMMEHTEYLSLKRRGGRREEEVLSDGAGGDSPVDET